MTTAVDKQPAHDCGARPLRFRARRTECKSVQAADSRGFGSYLVSHACFASLGALDIVKAFSSRGVVAP
jgi:hypothetical protein